MRHFYIRAEMRKHTNDKPDLVDADFEKAANFAALLAPYRHAQLSAVKLAGDPNNPARIADDASIEELKALVMTPPLAAPCGISRLVILSAGALRDPT